MCIRWLTNGPFVKAQQHLFQIFAMICAHQMEPRPRIEISSLLNIKASLENHLLWAKTKKRKKTEGGGGGVRGSECLPRSHTHTQKRSHRSGMLALFTYCNETHLIEANLYGLCKQDFASSCIRCASQQEHIRSPYGTLDIIRTHIFPPPCTFFSLIVSCFIWPPFHSPERIFLTFLLSYWHVLDN